MSVRPTTAELVTALPGDDLVERADVVMDRAFTLDAVPERVWPWLVQLGKGRAGWYLPASVERLLPARGRGARSLDPRWLDLAVGDRVPDYGGASAHLQAVTVDPPRALVYLSPRGRLVMSWVLVLRPDGDGATRVHIRLRIGGVRRRWLVRRVGGAFDLATIVGLRAGLAERVPPD